MFSRSSYRTGARRRDHAIVLKAADRGLSTSPFSVPGNVGTRCCRWVMSIRRVYGLAEAIGRVIARIFERWHRGQPSTLRYDKQRRGVMGEEPGNTRKAASVKPQGGILLRACIVLSLCLGRVDSQTPSGLCPSCARAKSHQRTPLDRFESIAPGIIQRKSVMEPMETASRRSTQMIPIARVGRGADSSAIAETGPRPHATHDPQPGRAERDVVCVYVPIGQNSLRWPNRGIRLVAKV